MTTMLVLNGVMQGKKDTLHAYIDHFTKAEVVMGGSNESLKC